MVKISLVMGLAAFTSLSLAQPIEQEEGTVTSSFSFEEWANGISADPEGNHLSPDEAVASAIEFGTESSSHEKRAGNIVCNTAGVKVAKADSCLAPFRDKKAPSAAACIDKIARRGGQTCHSKTITTFCSNSGAEIVGATTGPKFDVKTTCQKVAATAGKVMDICFRSDNTVQGVNFLNGKGGRMAVNISGKK
ncbi:hypothetical protein N3K66_006239 [Trichothecium roseum]|uniref:Uncharacterized protein n=1 Tax=Trichothecium roseum TaxID=47278 RepID=A0ACC0V1L1_9HYPO|nr:hypothetical protein N3K66_006239 [Trichothecium roseum]